MTYENDVSAAGVQPLEETLAAMEQQLERQARWMRFQKIWLCVKLLLVLALALYFGPKLWQAWQQYEQMMTQVNELTAQVEEFLPEMEALSTQVQDFLVTVEERLDTVAQTMETLQEAFAPIAQFMSRFG